MNLFYPRFISATWSRTVFLPFRSSIHMFPSMAVTGGEKEPLIRVGRDEDFGNLTLAVRVFDLAITFMGPSKSLHELVDLPRWKHGWWTLVEQFDDEFPKLAAAVLQYHARLSYIDHGEAVPEMLALRDRLLEPYPDFTAEELEVLASFPERKPEVVRRDPETGTVHTKIPPATDEERAIFHALEGRLQVWRERQRQAKLEFVEMMPRLSW